MTPYIGPPESRLLIVIRWLPLAILESPWMIGDLRERGPAGQGCGKVS